MVWFTKLDCQVWLLLTTGYCLSSDLCFFILGLVLLLCNLLWTFLHAMLCFIISQSLAPQPCLILIAPRSINRSYTFGHPLLVLLTRGCCCLWGNQMVWFGILDNPVCLPSLLLVITCVMAVSCLVVCMAKISSWS
jgi:hypothetical protein